MRTPPRNRRRLLGKSWMQRLLRDNMMIRNASRSAPRRVKAMEQVVNSWTVNSPGSTKILEGGIQASKALNLAATWWWGHPRSNMQEQQAIRLTIWMTHWTTEYQIHQRALTVSTCRKSWTSSKKSLQEKRRITAVATSWSMEVVQVGKLTIDPVLVASKKHPRHRRSNLHQITDMETMKMIKRYSKFGHQIPKSSNKSLCKKRWDRPNSLGHRVSTKLMTAKITLTMKLHQSSQRLNVASWWRSWTTAWTIATYKWKEKLAAVPKRFTRHIIQTKARPPTNSFRTRWRNETWPKKMMKTLSKEILSSKGSKIITQQNKNTPCKTHKPYHRTPCHQTNLLEYKEGLLPRSTPSRRWLLQVVLSNCKCSSR